MVCEVLRTFAWSFCLNLLNTTNGHAMAPQKYSSYRHTLALLLLTNRTSQHKSQKDVSMYDFWHGTPSDCLCIIAHNFS